MSTTGRKACTSGDHCRPVTLDEALYCVVHHTPHLDSKAIADRIGIRHSYLAAAVNPDGGDHQLQARLLLPLMTVTGNHAPVEFLARAVGGVFVPLPSEADGCPRTAALAIVSRLGDVTAAMETALADDAIDLAEAAEIHRRLQRLMDAVARKAGVISRVAQEGIR